MVAQFAPLNIALGAGHLLLTDPAPSVLVPDVGLRVACKAKVHWPVLGLELPVTLHSLTLLVRPAIAPGAAGDRLVFRLEIESVDLAGLPKMLDRRITEMANAELVRKEVELSWGFAKTLTHSFPLPQAIAPLELLNLAVVAARMKIRSDGISLAVQFDSGVKRRAVEPTDA